ncbi:DNA polymerase III alpha subunit [Mucinivorans hirudinis]|uniref:DNA polymerase III alpha subunit n=1 Tax=Mucinivorans hirudinis TaxID=1433126 RepID=A0A060R8K2_9BACT|nr:DNA polymerase III alpha subunit [Mucinivorans hirudinis]
MNELIPWLEANKISYSQLDDEVIEIEEFGKLFLADLTRVTSIFKSDAEQLKFNLMESPEVLMEEGIFYVVFPFGNNWYYYDLREEFRFNILKYVGKRKPTQLQTPFVNLGVHTPYELLSGSGDLSLWVRKAKYLGHSAIGICDYNTMAATLNLQKECKAAGIKHVFGYSLTVEHLDEKVEMKVYAINQIGLQNLLRIQKAVMVDSENQTISVETLNQYGEGNILVFGKLSGGWLKANRRLISGFKQRFERCYFQVDLSEYKADRIDVEVLNSAATFFENFGNPLTLSFEIDPILIVDCYYLDRDDAKNKILLGKVATGAAHRQSDEQYFKDVDEHFAVLKPLFNDKWNVEKLFEKMCQPTVEIAEKAMAMYETDRNFMPRYDMTPEEQQKYDDRHTMFLSLLEEGFARLVPADKSEQYRKRLEHEVYILESTDNVDYMLVQYDTVNWARANGILVGCGRGSAGGCLVMYLLGLTLIDPIKFDLLFERFLLPERAGLYPTQTTKFVNEMKTNAYVEMTLDNGKVLKLDKDAQLLVIRDGTEQVVYADQLIDGDDVVFDHRDYLWMINYFGNGKTNNHRQ